MTDATAEMIEKAVLASGVRTININSTTGGKHFPKSRHPSRMACDINVVERYSVSDPKARPLVEALQEAFNRQANIRENFGPVTNTKTESDGTVMPRPDQAPTHLDHIHVSGQR